MKKEKINTLEYSNLINKYLKPGILLNTNGDKFNSMVIGWGNIGILWNIDTFVVYVRQSRYTKSQIDKTKKFTISVQLDDNYDKNIIRVMGSQSGRDINKADYVTLVESNINNTPGIKEFPLTIECEVIYQQDQILENIKDDIRNKCYPTNDPNDFHTVYVGKIVDAYIIKE